MNEVRRTSVDQTCREFAVVESHLLAVEQPMRIDGGDGVIVAVDRRGRKIENAILDPSTESNFANSLQTTHTVHALADKLLQFKCFAARIPLLQHRDGAVARGSNINEASCLDLDAAVRSDYGRADFHGTRLIQTVVRRGIETGISRIPLISNLRDYGINSQCM